MKCFVKVDCIDQYDSFPSFSLADDMMQPHNEPTLLDGSSNELPNLLDSIGPYSSHRVPCIFENDIVRMMHQ